MKIKKTISCLILTLMLVGMLTVALNVRTVDALASHSPILINGDSEFTPENGVTGGNGTATKPYIIEGWAIDASTANGIMIVNTSAYFIIRNVVVQNGTLGNFVAVKLQNVTNGVVMKIASTNNYGLALLNEVSRTKIENNTAIDFGRIWMDEYSQYNSIALNYLYSATYESSIEAGGNYSYVVGNTIIQATNGINVSGSFNKVYTNQISKAKGCAILLGSTGHSNLVVGNDVSYSTEGIAIDGSSNNYIVGNKVHHNTNGTTVAHPTNSSSGNYIVRNDVYSNDKGIVFDETPSSENFIHHNKFYDNELQKYNVPGAVNAWDDGYPSGGNYWKDYTGTDLYRGPYQNETGSDGIGDIPYPIDENNNDTYPLMNPPLFGDVNNDRVVNMRDIGMVVNAFGSFPDRSKWNIFADLNYNFRIDLKDIGLVCANFGKQQP